MHLSISRRVNNIKIICSIRFSLLITIDRFYKLFLTEGAFVNGVLETIFFALFHTARTLSGSLRSPPSPHGEGFVSGIPLPPIQPPPLRGTSFHRKEGVSTRAPSLGRGCRAQRGGVGFLLGWRSRLLFAFPIREGVVSGIAVSSYRSLPHLGRGTAQRWIGCSR